MAEPAIGKKAPAFTLKDTDGSPVSLNKDLAGRKTVIYFYPKDNTSGCTKEACSFRDHWTTLRRRKVLVYGISPDGPESHAKFRDKYQLPFPLLCDPDHKIAGKYGAWGEKNMYGKKTWGIKRSTFLLDEKGHILHIWKRPDVKRHAEQILEKLDELKAQK